jgi:hypothetical protein
MQRLMMALSIYLLEIFQDGIQLVEYLLEPKFVRLMDDDEKHLIVNFLVENSRLRDLSVQNLLQVQVLPVGNCSEKAGRRGCIKTL